MNYEDIEQIVIDKLHALGADKKFDTYEVDIPVGTDRPNVEHAITPYVLIDFGNKGQQEYGNQGITGTRDNMKYTSIIFEVVSNNPAVNRKICRLLRDEFEGYQPDPTWGELVEHIAAPLYARQPPEGGEFYPPRYTRTLAFVVDVDA